MIETAIAMNISTINAAAMNRGLETSDLPLVDSFGSSSCKSFASGAGTVVLGKRSVWLQDGQTTSVSCEPAATRKTVWQAGQEKPTHVLPLGVSGSTGKSSAGVGSGRGGSQFSAH